MRRSFVLLLLLFVLPFASAQAQQPQDPPAPTPTTQDPPPTSEDDTIKVDTDLVVVNVTITDLNNRYVSGLRRDDFRLFENKTQQKIVNFSFDESPFTVVILLDTSGSMENKLSLARAACSQFVNGIRTGDTFAIYSFGGTKVRMLQDFTEVRDLPDSIWGLKAERETPLYDGIVTAAEALAKRPEKRRAILVISDGADTKSKATLDQAMRKSLAAHAAFYAVDLSDNAVFGAPKLDNSAEVMKSLAERTGGRFFRTPGGSKLRDAFDATISELRQQYTLTYESSDARFNGKWRTIEVRVARPQLQIRSRQGYYARK
jgi:Ca-activated chloride channel homolog